MHNLDSIKEEVFRRRPVLAEIKERFGNLKLGNYVKDAWEVPAKKPDENFLNTISSFLFNIYGKSIVDKAKSQLLAKPLVSTIDHLGIWGHPIFVNAALIYSLHFNQGDLAIALATESVSLNNTSSWSGCILKHGEDAKLKRYSFFPDKLKTLPVFSAPVITQKEIKKLVKLGSWGEEFFSVINLDFGSLSFSNQACLCSYNLWKKVFPSAPKLIYLPLESVILEYLKQVLNDPQNIISKIILTPKGRELWQKYFGNEHTFMFWGLDSKGRRVALKSLTDDYDELFNFINSRKIYPSSPLCFVVLLLTGFACVGGFTQTTWLTEVKKKFVNLLKDMGGLEDIINNIISIPTKNFGESSLATLVIGNKEVQPTALDLLLTQKDYYPEYIKKAVSITLSESLDLAMPGIYEVVVPVRERGLV